MIKGSRTIIAALALLMATPATDAAPKRQRKGKGKARTEQTTSRAELQRQQKATQQEIAATRRKIKENDRAVSRNLAELGKLQGDIEVTRGQVAQSSRQVKLLAGQMGALSGQINTNEKELARMRQEYLKALKKIRARKGTSSNLAYIFSSKSIGEARRRMRYLREFADWRRKHSQQISGKVKELQGQRNELARSKTMHDRALSQQVTAQRNLESQYKAKDAIVVELKANGAALKDHLARKQSEANALKGRVAALIAEEQRIAEQRAAEERRAREAEERRIREAEERRRQELAQAEAQAAREKAEAAARQEKAEQQKKKEAEKTVAKAEKTRKPDKPKKEKKPKQKQEKASREDRNSGNNAYAEARKRRPRRDNGNTGSTLPKTQTVESQRPTASAGKSASGGRFESMRGSLPRPVAGSFRVTSRFGQHSLPDLPNVMYDNPGIDAEVSAGATAQAVFGGKVSGVYMIPGFSTVVIVNHGNYYTVYGNLSGASVKVGDVVKQGQAVGRVAASEDNPSVGQIHFEVWKNREKQDPLNWIR